jgi:hypothetical protein
MRHSEPWIAHSNLQILRNLSLHSKSTTALSPPCEPAMVARSRRQLLGAVLAATIGVVVWRFDVALQRWVMCVVASKKVIPR